VCSLSREHTLPDLFSPPPLRAPMTSKREYRYAFASIQRTCGPTHRAGTNYNSHAACPRHTDPENRLSQSTSAPAAAPPAPPPPLKGGQLVLATIAVALATFMNVLDTSIANVAIPTISGNLGVSVDEGTWVITVFAAANACRFRSPAGSRNASAR
jgi:DHA2 family multidrug resistance protein